ncbi:HlyD family secretion protein [Sphingobium subterraneum]|uniref:Membrane fusion protein (Multidrug efflux system) n=1 Tax=Sphingobium subterraneum TaxID=627688 RepID=A0A841J2X9_9SPHN|nr:HlyD family efflux transporter periplasmic adaptor subunit [Sphingobium subterraneum]MBB6125030.1 membrane fusion protein (multidrug efflux system) [Sphingobium subterraneum]
MGVAFSRTTGALAGDTGKGALLVIGTTSLLTILWFAWFAFGSVAVYESSRFAHVEVTSASRGVSAQSGGRLIATGLYIGRRVRAGEVLAELESEIQKLRLAQAEARLAALPTRVDSLRRQLSGAQQAETAGGRAHSAAVSAAHARAEGALASAEFDKAMARRQRLDSESGGAAPADAERGETQARNAKAISDAMRHDESRISGEADTQRLALAGESARLTAALRMAEGEMAAAQAEVAQLRYELDNRKIRSPIDGVIGDVAVLKLGDMVAGGVRLATVVPDENLHIVASFDAARGLGRLSRGQQGRLRLDGFSWTQYGDFAAQVQRVAGESEGNLLRVELTLKPGSGNQPPLRHGMSGTVDVAIERVSPAILLLRAIGQFLR